MRKDSAGQTEGKEIAGRGCLCKGPEVEGMWFIQGTGGGPRRLGPRATGEMVAEPGTARTRIFTLKGRERLSEGRGGADVTGSAL